MRSVIICVDDDRIMLQALAAQLSEYFKENYIIEKALSGEEGLLIIDEYKEKNIDISVVISDYIMPVMRGDQFLENVHKKDMSIRKIMLTGYSVLDGIIYAINHARLYRFISKPWDNKDLVLTVLEAIKSYEQEKKLALVSRNFQSLYNKYSGMYKTLQLSYSSTLSSIIKALEEQTNNDEGHSLAVMEYCVTIANLMGIPKEEHDILCYCALLHEIGKIKFTEEELGKLDRVRDNLDYTNPLLEKLNEKTLEIVSDISDESFIPIIKNQYKKYDPDTPLLSRVLAVANMFDNIMRNNPKSKQLALTQLLRYADFKILDNEIVKTFIKPQITIG